MKSVSQRKSCLTTACLSLSLSLCRARSLSLCHALSLSFFLFLSLSLSLSPSHTHTHSLSLFLSLSLSLFLTYTLFLALRCSTQCRACIERKRASDDVHGYLLRSGYCFTRPPRKRIPCTFSGSRARVDKWPESRSKFSGELQTQRPKP